ncbi:MAG: hypothetical protein AVDCRST_MAG55-897, partial [uncultured Rubrobacteraceae bacterium]
GWGNVGGRPRRLPAPRGRLGGPGSGPRGGRSGGFSGGSPPTRRVGGVRRGGPRHGPPRWRRIGPDRRAARDLSGLCSAGSERRSRRGEPRQGKGSGSGWNNGQVRRSGRCRRRHKTPWKRV